MKCMLVVSTFSLSRCLSASWREFWSISGAVISRELRGQHSYLVSFFSTCIPMSTLSPSNDETLCTFAFIIHVMLMEYFLFCHQCSPYHSLSLVSICPPWCMVHKKHTYHQSTNYHFLWCSACWRTKSIRFKLQI